jgi:GT2 family glycosyltransferase
MSEPFFSIIVPTHGRPKSLAACLESLSNLDYPRDRFEVIVVDDGSDAPPREVVSSFTDRVDVVLLTQAHGGPAAARSTGAARAKGEYLAFTDDDCTVDPDWLRALSARFATANDVAVGGRTINALPDDPYATASQIIVDIVYAYYNTNPERARFVASNNLAMAKDQFNAVGGFDSSFPLASEDRDLCDRWVHHGYRITYAPEVVVHHSRPMSFAAFCRQHFNYGRGAFRFERARARRGSGGLVKELGFYRRLPSLVSRSLSQVRGRRAVLPAALLVVWQVANAAGFFWEWASQPQRKPVRQSNPEAKIINPRAETDRA